MLLLKHLRTTSGPDNALGRYYRFHPLNPARLDSDVPRTDILREGLIVLSLLLLLSLLFIFFSLEPTLHKAPIDWPPGLAEGFKSGQ